MAPGDPETVAEAAEPSEAAEPDTAGSETSDTSETAASERSLVGRAAPSAHAANGSGPAVAPLIESGQIRRALALAQKRTDLNWSVFVGTLGANPRVQAEARHAELGPAAAKSVLIAVDPAGRHLEIVTGEHARKHLDDRSCALAAAAMTSSFAVRDLDGGIANGILALVEHVRSAR